MSYGISSVPGIRTIFSLSFFDKKRNSLYILLAFKLSLVIIIFLLFSMLLKNNESDE